MSLVEKVGVVLTRGDGRVDAQQLVERLDALSRFLRVVDPHLPDADLVAAHTLVERAGSRLALSLDHTVVALAGSTGSGKSSLFNALARLKLSPVGVRRPTTGIAHACVWGPLELANPLLDWVGVLPRQRYVRESALDGDDEAAMRGLVLLDLPDFDSVEHGHRLEVDRLLGLVDQVVWVVDPQKYGDRILHSAYLRQFRARSDITIVVLNQADRLSTSDTELVLADLKRLLEEDGLVGAPVMATSAKQPGMLNELRETLEKSVADRQAALRRLAGDLDTVSEQLADMIGPPAAEDEVDRATVRQLSDALAASAGVPAVAAATGNAYRHRAAASTGWPLVRGLRRLRPDPLRRLHLDTEPASPDVVPRTSVPEADAAQKSAVGLSVRAVAIRAAGLGTGAELGRPVANHGPAGRARPGRGDDRPRPEPQAALVARRRPAAVAVRAGGGGRPGLAARRVRSARAGAAAAGLSQPRRGPAADGASARRAGLRILALAAAQADRQLGSPARPAAGRAAAARGGHRGGP